ncbi:hypothetical protein [Paraburkholderia hospita]|uniref:hypothetical protein n=1 Tax=Paraburkholderia hospita TaxID=169430 RepID=UPI001F609469|nr:hypothetical protein [Paraburkholderia hospita]
MNRLYEEVHMPFTEGTTLLHPERALLKWEDIRNRSDIGQICYLTRNTSSTRHTRHTFDHTSFSSERALELTERLNRAKGNAKDLQAQPRTCRSVAGA